MVVMSVLVLLLLILVLVEVAAKEDDQFAHTSVGPPSAAPILLSHLSDQLDALGHTCLTREIELCKEKRTRHELIDFEYEMCIIRGFINCLEKMKGVKLKVIRICIVDCIDGSVGTKLVADCLFKCYEEHVPKHR